MHILLADDSEIVRRRLAGLLGDIPHVRIVGEAEDVDHALESIDTLLPDLVIVDLHMPGNGFRLIEELSQRPKRPLIMVLTNYAYRQYRDRVFRAGAEFFFDKVTEFDAVVRAVTDLSRLGQDRPTVQ
jgi:DNA-binding NarL/FixJ family response regulator